MLYSIRANKNRLMSIDKNTQEISIDIKYL